MSLVNTRNSMNTADMQPTSDRLIVPTANRGKILLFSYAFPPMQVQMTAAVLKPMAAIAQLGYEVDVLCADSFSPHLPLDKSLLPFANESFSQVTRLNPPDYNIAIIHRYSKALPLVPDLMAMLHQPAFEYLMNIDLSQYHCVMTWSPFHSINPVMVRVKKQRKNIHWIAQFSDPWAGNPLEINKLTKLWNKWHEPRTVKAADFIVHSSAYSLDLMLKKHPSSVRNKTAVLPHVFNEVLYPQRPKVKNARITMRYVGVLYGRRSPETLFLALNKLYERRKDLKGMLAIELIGHMPNEMLNTAAALSLPSGTIINIANVSYIKSLELMYDADILLLIEANIRQNLFLPSKLSDYIGANTPIVGLVPPGGSEDALVGLDCRHARPSDITGISNAIEDAVEHVMADKQASWCNESFRHTFSGQHVASRFIEIINKIG